MRWLPPGADPALAPLFATRALRGFADGFVAILLPVYLLAQGFNAVQVGAVASATLAGSALATLAVGAWGHRCSGRTLLLAAALLMAAALSPVLAGWLFQSGWPAAPLLACGALKITYDLVLWRAFRRARLH